MELLEKFRKLTPSEIDRSIPRMARAICVVRLSEEERDLIIKLLEEKYEGKLQD